MSAKNKTAAGPAPHGNGAAGAAAAVLEEEKYQRLVACLRGLERALIAYSGGVDSTFLLKVAHDVLGEGAVGVLAVSESLDRNESRDALALVERLGIPVRVVSTHEYEREEYRRNDSRRCYHCKTELFSVLRVMAQRDGFPYILDGSNLDDAGDYRPGMQARAEQGVRSPLQEAGLTKEDIRRFSRALGLPTWDKPAAPCLSSRIPYGKEVTREKLRQIEAAEAALRGLGFRTVRVRHHDAVARIEVPVGEIERLLDAAVREEAIARVKDAGFVFVTVDLQGFRSGAMNEVLQGARSGGGAAPIPPSQVGIFS